MRSFPWDSIVEGLDEATGFPIYDRPYNAEDFRKWIARFFSDGVFADDPNAFLCTATNNGMTVNVAPGTALIKGTDADEDKIRTLSFEASDKNYARIDTVVLRWNANLEVRAIDLYVHKGTPAVKPVRPELTRIEDQVWELGLCDVNIPANTAAISAARITDTRLETSRCGIVTPFAEFDTTSFYDLIKSKSDEMLDDAEDYIDGVKDKALDKLHQAQADINDMKSDLQKQTDTAVELAKSALEETTAGILQNQIDDINDYTTGINLLRGTRDFVLGTEVVFNNILKNGFCNVDNFTFYKDKEGYTVANKTQINQTSSNNPSIYSNAIFGLQNGEKITISFDLMVDNVDIWKSYNFLFYVRGYKDGSLVCNDAFSFNDLKINGKNSYIGSFYSGIWYRCSYVYTIKNDIDFIYLVLFLNRNGSINFRKIKVERGEINNPIWSPSPFDIDYINDETTGINLLRGTRDFAAGIVVSGQGSQPRKGWQVNTQDAPTFVDDDGFAVMRRSKTSGTNSVASYQIVEGDFEAGETLTYSFEIKIDDLASFTSSILSQIGIAQKSNSAYVSSIFIPKADYQINEGEWTKIVFHYTPSRSTDDSTYLLVGLGMNNTGTIEFKRPMLQRGRVNHPIWSASPFDVVQVDKGLTIDSPVYYLGDISGDHEIQAYDDLNNYIKPNTYACYANSRVATLSNIPKELTSAFKLFVERGNGQEVPGRYIRQKIVVYDETAKEYIRYCDNTSTGTWTNWRQTYANTTVRPIAGGGTGASTAEGARSNLGLSLPLAVSSGGTGGTTALEARSNLGIVATRATVQLSSSDNPKTIEVSLGETLKHKPVVSVTPELSTRDSQASGCTIKVYNVRSSGFTCQVSLPASVSGAFSDTLTLNIIAIDLL